MSDEMKIMELPEQYHDPFPFYPDSVSFWKRLDDLRMVGSNTDHGGQLFRQVQLSHPNRQPTLKEILLVRKALFKGDGTVMLVLPETTYFKWDQTRTFNLLQAIAATGMKSDKADRSDRSDEREEKP